MVTVKTIKDIIEHNNWRTSHWEQSVDATLLFNSGILTMMGAEANDAISALNPTNMQGRITMGQSAFAFAEQNLTDTSSDKDAGQIEATFKEYDVKTFYGNQWWRINTIERDLMTMNRPLEHVNNKIGSYWATQLNKLIGATVTSLSKITEITIGDGTKNLSLDMVLDSRILKADKGFGELGRMYMSSNTLYDILKKINSGVIPYPIIVETHGDLAVSRTTPVGTPATPLYQSTAQQRSSVPVYKFAGVTPIKLDDSITDGVISMVENGAFGYARKDLDNALMYVNDPKSFNGAGSEQWGTKSMYVLHPLGFGFIGKFGVKDGAGVTYTKRSGLTEAELIAYKQYELVDDVKLSKIMNLKVKIG